MTTQSQFTLGTVAYSTQSVDTLTRSISINLGRIPLAAKAQIIKISATTKRRRSYHTPQYYSQPIGRLNTYISHQTISRHIKLIKPPRQQSRESSPKNLTKTGQASRPDYQPRPTTINSVRETVTHPNSLVHP
ncbi:hypothetical protein WN48_06717 [Eufriesea mexicana]|uniref:Uncharacterized protein n=1 Tax=Eufriesea mexicana TaxID=516756 RepID=A0A310SLP1_9HYME|nr:hypothetical protein WN48_06717 [Eufriesea mexicana]